VLLDAADGIDELPLLTKDELAERIVERIVALLAARPDEERLRRPPIYDAAPAAGKESQ
jgi:hypothetical protein